MGFLSALFGKKNAEVKVAQESAAPKRTEDAYLTETVVFGMYRYRRAGEDSTVFFVDESRGIRKKLVDSVGNIQSFPGIVKEAFWSEYVSSNALKPQIRFRTSFEKREEKWIMLWQIQPDGRYWTDDDGFGAEHDEEITLYAYVDLDGNYTGPFRIYNVGDRYCSLDRFEFAHIRWYDTALQALRAGKLEDHADAVFPRIHGMGLGVGIRKLSEYYTIWSKADARSYWNHPLLSGHLIEISEELLKLDIPIHQICAYPDYRMVQSCMTMFFIVSKEAIFKEVLDKFFSGEFDEMTYRKISE